jgi:putative tryptophan/tyrosine transport system substrate-binding protein
VISRRTFVTALTGGVLAAPFAAGAQQGRVPRIGWLGGPTRETAQPFVGPFLQGLRDLGWVEGQNIIIEWRFAGGRAERLPNLAAELVRLHVDLIVVPSTPTAVAAKNATTAIPLVSVGGNDPVGLGLAASLAQPGGNLTGLTISLGPEIAGKQLELLKETVPKVSRVSVLWNPATPGNALALREAEIAGRALGVELQPLEARRLSDFGGVFAAMNAKRAGALLVLGDVMFVTHRTQLAERAAKSRLPAMYANREFVDDGGLMSYGAKVSANFRRAATYVDKILKGAKPAELPIERPTTFELIINSKTAKALGLTIPHSVLLRADEIIA